MKRDIYCPRCIERGFRPKFLAQVEDFTGSGYMWLWCKRCAKSVRVPMKKYSVNN